MPSGVFKPYAGVSPAILFFPQTNSGGTDHVWFYDMQADGFSLDDKRTPQAEKSDLPDILTRWKAWNGEGGARSGEGGARNAELARARTEKSFCVPSSELRANDYDLSINRYKEIEYAAVEHDAPREILKRLARLEAEIAEGQQELEEMLG
jgi:type I restriction enzyme M protein